MIINKESSQPLVKSWQTFLQGQGYMAGQVYFLAIYGWRRWAWCPAH